MTDKREKIWERPWTTEEIIENAENWTLAGDVALLNTLKSFANTLITKTNEVDSKLSNLTRRLDETSLRLDIVHNEFQSLRNTQFIESRVYEDDETLPSKEEEKEKMSNATENEDEENKIKHMKEAVNKGLDVIDKYFDKVEVNVSDTEEESDYVSYVLKPKDIYIDRPLPYVIGTDEWFKKWHVGLVDSSSDSEIEEILDKYSDSDSESEAPLPDRSQVKGTSDTSSELDYSHKTPSSRPVANSTFTDVKQDAVGSSDSDQNSLPVHTPLSNQNFAEQLAVKLGNVINQKVDIPEPEINTRPIQKVSESNRFPGIFFDEPPPLDVDDDILHSSAKKGLFSGGDNLFDDTEDEKEILADASKESSTPKIDTVTVKPSVNLFDDDEVDDGFLTNSTLKENKDKKQTTRIPQVKTKSLFDDDSSDDDIFKAPSAGLYKPSYLKPAAKPTVPLFDDEPPELEVKKEEPAEISPKKKPAGGVSLFGGKDIFANQKIGSLLKNRVRESSEDSDDGFEEKPKIIQSKPKEDPKPVKIETEEGENKIEPTNKPVISSLKPSNKIPKSKETNKPRKISLLDDVGKTKQLSTDTNIDEQTPTKRSKPKKISLFGDDEDDSIEKKGKKTSLFDDVDDLFKDDLFSGAGIKKFTSSLFDDDDDIKGGLLADNNKDNDSKLEDDKREGSYLVIDDKNTHLQVSEANKSSKEDGLEEVNNKTDFHKPDDTVKIENISKTNLSEESSEVAEKAVVEEPFISSENTDLNAPKVKPISFEDNIFDNEESNTNSSKTTNLKFSLFEDDAGTVSDLFSSKVDIESSLITNQGNQDLDDSKSNNQERDKYEDGDKEQNKFEDDITKPSVSEESRNADTTKAIRPSHISLFRNSPPPDDDDWDTKSDDNDPFLDDDENNERSVLFDEPVSRPSYDFSGVNEISSGLFDGPVSRPSYDSSGIGVENTRVEGDVSSFYPYASSSRRLSTEIYNEQQSADSFFVTKNNTEPPHLDVIVEKSLVANNNSIKVENQMSTDSVLEITPSGTSEGLYLESASSSSEEIKNSGNNQTKESSKSFKSPLIEDESVPSSNPLGISLMGKIFDKKEESSSTEKGECEPPKESKGTVADMRDRLENSPEKEKKPPSGPPGKLKHNLQINVNALMPGSAPPKRRELTKSQSFESATTDEADFSSLPITADDFGFESSHSEKKRSPSAERTNSNEVEVLHSITKDRARIPIRRKPSTRRGRKELRKVMSVDIDQLEQNDLLCSSSAEPDLPPKNTSNNEASSQVLPPNHTSMFGNDKPISEKPVSSENIMESCLIESTPLITSQVSEAVIVKTKDRPISLFDNEDDPNIGLFSSNSVSSVKDIESLFSTDNLDKDLFGSSFNKTISVPSIKKKKTTENITESTNDLAQEKSEISIKKTEEIGDGTETLYEKESNTAKNKAEKVTEARNTSAQKETGLSTNKTESTKSSAQKDSSSLIENKTTNKKADIFSIDDDDEDDIFSPSSKKLPLKLDLKNKPLFDDENDDDDLFGSGSLMAKTRSKKDDKKTIPQKSRVGKVTTVKKLENIRTDIDPLSSLLKDDPE